MDGTDITSGEELKAAVRQKKAGDTITLTVYRDGGKTDLSLTLDEDNQDRQDALSDLQDELSQQRQQQARQQQGGYYSNWPFGFGFGSNY